MMDNLSYKGYTATVEVDFDANVITGRVDGIDDVVTFWGHTPEHATEEFRRSVDEYLNVCAEWGREPQVPRRAAA